MAVFDLPQTKNPDAPLRRFFERPRPANDNRRVYRSIKSAAPYDNICSTRWKYVDVSVPRVSILDGAPDACRRIA